MVVKKRKANGDSRLSEATTEKAGAWGEALTGSAGPGRVGPRGCSGRRKGQSRGALALGAAASGGAACGVAEGNCGLTTAGQHPGANPRGLCWGPREVAGPRHEGGKPAPSNAPSGSQGCGGFC